MKKTRMRNRISAGKVLLVLAGAVQGAQYAQAFLYVHSGLGKVAVLGGVAAGAVVTGAIAYAGNQLPGLRAKAARRWGTVFFVMLLTLSPFVLTPVNFYSMDAALRTAIGGYAWVLAGLVASLPEIALGLVALVDRSLITLPASSSDAASVAQHASATLKDAASNRQRRSKMLPATFYRCECGFQTENRNKYAGHQGKCGMHQVAKSGQPIPVEMPARKEQA